MKSTNIFLFVFALILCNFSAFAQKTENRAVSGFHIIDSRGGYDIFLTQGEKEGLRLEGEADDLAKIETGVKSGTLVIKRKNSNWDTKSEKIKIFIDYIKLEEIKNSGSADLVFEKLHTGSKLALNIAGSGSVVGKFELDDISISIAGSGSAEISGKAVNQKISISGSGDVKAFEMLTANCDVQIAGSGDVEVNVEKKIYAKIAGSGDIRYKGNPANIESKTAGSGSIKKMN